jgi:hypothetical protein
MNQMLSYLDQNSGGIYVLLIVIFAIVLVVQWIWWIFGWGRFASDWKAEYQSQSRRSREGSVKYMLTQLVVKIINDFRHLLALVIVLIYFLALGYALVVAGQDLDEVATALQAVTSTLGGLIGAIIGYYFGESAATKGLEVHEEEDGAYQSEEQEAEQEISESEVNEDIEVPKPPPEIQVGDIKDRPPSDSDDV